jgi:hypothetical protein
MQAPDFSPALPSHAAEIQRQLSTKVGPGKNLDTTY